MKKKAWLSGLLGLSIIITTVFILLFGENITQIKDMQAESEKIKEQKAQLTSDIEQLKKADAQVPVSENGSDIFKKNRLYESFYGEWSSVGSEENKIKLTRSSVEINNEKYKDVIYDITLIPADADYRVNDSVCLADIGIEDSASGCFAKVEAKAGDSDNRFFFIIIDDNTLFLYDASVGFRKYQRLSYSGQDKVVLIDG